MRQRLARLRLEAALRDRFRLDGADARLLVRSQDALLERGAERLRLVPLREDGPPPQEHPSTGSFLAFGQTEAPSEAALAWLRERDDGTLAALARAALSVGPSRALHVGGDCEQACHFCRDAGSRKRRDRSRTLRELRPRLEELRAVTDRVIFRGDDALANRDLATLVSEASALGFHSVGLLCPGPRLSAPGAAEGLTRAGLDVVEVALYGATPRTHDKVVGCKGAFVRLLEGLARLRRVGVQVIVHTALLPETLPALGDMAELCFDAGLCFERLEGLVADEGGAERFRAAAPDLAHVRAALDEAWPQLPRPLEIVDVPLCAVAPRDGYHVRPQPPEGNGRLPLRHAGPCARCSRKALCAGVSQPYLDEHGEEGLRPFE